MVLYGIFSFFFLQKQEKICLDSMGVLAYKYIFFILVIVQDFMFVFCQIIVVSFYLCFMLMVVIFVFIGNDEGDDVDRLRKVCVVIFCEFGKQQLNILFFYIVFDN